MTSMELFLWPLWPLWNRFYDLYDLYGSVSVIFITPIEAFLWPLWRTNTKCFERVERNRYGRNAIKRLFFATKPSHFWSLNRIMVLHHNYSNHFAPSARDRRAALWIPIDYARLQFCVISRVCPPDSYEDDGCGWEMQIDGSPSDRSLVRHFSTRISISLFTGMPIDFNLPGYLYTSLSIRISRSLSTKQAQKTKISARSFPLHSVFLLSFVFTRIPILL